MRTSAHSPRIGVGAVVGHNFPVWLGFKGGKGVATTIGLFLAAIFRYSSLAALVALALAPLYAFILGYPNAALAFLALGILGWARHHANIARLLKGAEPKIGGAKTA